MEREHSHAWGAPLVIGILLVIGGAFALVAAVMTSLISILYIGAMLIVVGVLEVIAAFRLRHTGTYVLYLLAGVLAVVVGALFLYRPLAGLRTVTLLMAGYLFASGLFHGIVSISDRYRRWGWDFAYALLTLALGVYIVGSPTAKFWVLGTVVSAEIIMRGVTLIAASFVFRDIDRGILAPTPLRTGAARPIG